MQCWSLRLARRSSRHFTRRAKGESTHMMGNYDEETNQDIESLGSLPEFRIYISSQGGEPVARDIKGEVALREALDRVTAEYPQDLIYVREVNESVILMLGPGKSYHFLGKRDTP